MPGLFLYFCFQCIGVVVRMAHGFVISRFAIISFVLYDYYPLGVSFLFYFANSTYNYRAALPIKRAKGGRKKLATTTTEMFMHRLLNTYLNRTMNAEEKTSAKKTPTSKQCIFRVLLYSNSYNVSPSMEFSVVFFCCCYVWAIEKVLILDSRMIIAVGALLYLCETCWNDFVLEMIGANSVSLMETPLDWSHIIQDTTSHMQTHIQSISVTWTRVCLCVCVPFHSDKNNVNFSWHANDGISETINNETVEGNFRLLTCDWLMQFKQAECMSPNGISFNGHSKYWQSKWISSTKQQQQPKKITEEIIIEHELGSNLNEKRNEMKFQPKQDSGKRAA